MSRTITEKRMFLDATGKPHPYRSWAEQANLYAELLDVLRDYVPNDTACDIVNALDANKKLVREYLTAGEEMQREVLAS